LGLRGTPEIQDLDHPEPRERKVFQDSLESLVLLARQVLVVIQV